MSLLGDDIEREPTPDHMGHRARLRARFLETEGEGFADYELLELLLTLAIPRRDVKPLAKSLLRRFGTFEAVLSASQEELMRVDGVADTTVAALKLVQASALRMMRQQVMDRPVLNSWQRLLDYLAADMAHRGIEYFRLLFLDAKNHLIADEIQQSGSIAHTPVYPREIVKRALEVGATAIILVHNHPSGDPTPSKADIDMTKEIVRATAPVGITVHDHLIVGKSGTASFKSLGLL
jgi:DNA repair protein RadC